ncbi:MAG: hypothetical protein E7813_15345 [Bradyrhizobium sp.]|uniref:hypothetical protein n=1 Tax=Bradyrhizobium sp. TaxID=376 RepID=UPI0012279931|nr:hypothetical protein [Bradyrhizobium sp.]THD65335.1 MAG: hypothetical protein E7813_15345 [Bradyrhizobium sp.]
MKPRVSLREALNDPSLMGHVLAGESFKATRTILIASMGEELTDDERPLFTKLTGRAHEPLQRVSELVEVIGRRGSKTQGMAACATYLAGLVDYRDVLVPGETGVLLCLAQDQRVAKQLLDYCEANFAASPILSQLVLNRTSDTIELKGNIRIEVRPASFRKLRGPTYIAVIADEVAFWFTEEGRVNIDTEIIASVTPGLLTTHGMLIMASSPYAKRGVLWDVYKKHFGPNGSPSVLVCQGTTRDFNPTIEQSEIDRLLEKDPARNAAEYLAIFRTDLQPYVSIEAAESCVDAGVFERPPNDKTTYYGFVDPSGAAVDSFTACVAHMNYGEQTVTIDAIRETKVPFSPEQVCEEYAKLFQSYRIGTIFSDKYAGAWPVEQFGRFGIRCEQSAKPKSDLYTDLLPLILSARVHLIDHPKMIAQLCALERRTARGGRDSIDHPPNGFDDIINAVAGAVSISLFRYGSYNLRAMGDGDDDDDPDGARAWRARRLSAFIYSGGLVRL